jgi:peptidoglycan/LPS O-acetylase OafA/YrhL
VGLLIAKEKNKLPDLVEKKYNYLIAIVAAMIYFLLRYIIGKYPENYWVDLLNIVSSVFFALAVVFVWLKINLKGRLWRHLGEVSYYIFLTQFVVFHIFAGNHIYITDKWLFAITSGCTCILFAEVSCYIFRNTKGQVNDKNI